MISMLRSPRPLALCLSLSLIGLTACSEHQPVEPEPVVSDVLAAKGGNPGKPDGGGNGGGGDGGDESADPEVNATDPDSAPQDTTLDVLVVGTGFDPGSTVDFLIDGATTSDVSTNSTAFVSDTELRANITIDAEAVADLYDVRVTTSKGKKGVGIELFAVTAPPLTLANPPLDPAPAGLYGDGGIYLGAFNDGGQGNGNYHAIPACEASRAMNIVLPAEWEAVGTVSTCDWSNRSKSDDGQRVRFHVPGLLFADCADGSACPFGQDAPVLTNGTNFAPTLNYFLHVDADGDGKFGERNEPAYNVVWTDGKVAVLDRASDGTPCRFQVTAGRADLWAGDSRHPATGAAVALDAVVRRVDGPCGF